MGMLDMPCSLEQSTTKYSQFFCFLSSLQKNTFTEKLDLTDNYIEAAGGVALARMLLDNCYITEIVSY